MSIMRDFSLHYGVIIGEYINWKIIILAIKIFNHLDIINLYMITHVKLGVD